MKKKIFIVLLVFILISLISVLFINYNVKSKYEDKIISLEKVNKLNDVDAIVVLGAKVNDKKQVSLMLKDRLDRGIDVLNTSVSDVLLLSGDGVNDNNEIEGMRNYTSYMHVDDNYIKEDSYGVNTSSSMYNLKDKFKYKKVIIVTQKYHMYRALYIANEIGLDAYGVIAREKEYKGQLYRDLREVMARCKDFVLVRSK